LESTTNEGIVVKPKLVSGLQFNIFPKLLKKKLNANVIGQNTDFSENFESSLETKKEF
jgi:hypothetical protein